MKLYTTLICFALTLIVNVITAQTRYGVKVGPNLANQRYHSTPPGFPTQKIGTQLLAGFQIGTFAQFKLNNKFNVATEINYSQIGSKVKYTPGFIINPDGSISYPTGEPFYTRKLTQIEIPIWLQYHLNKRFYAGLGPIFGINLSSKTENLLNNSFKTDYHKKIDLGAGVLLGCNVYKKIDLNVKYNFGLLNIHKGDIASLTNRVLNFAVLYSLK